MTPLLLRYVLGMPLILLVHIVGICVVSQKPKTLILGLTKTNYNASYKAQTDQVDLIILYKAVQL